MVREEWENNSPIREALPHEIIFCKVSGRKITSGIGKAICDKRSKRTMREFLAQKGRMKRTTFELVDCEDVDK